VDGTGERTEITSATQSLGGSDDDGTSLPLIGYPITWWIWVALALALSALLVRGAMALRARRADEL
jgi:hypothetical protein